MVLKFIERKFIRTGRSKAEREQRRQAAAADARAQEAQGLSRELIELARPTFELGQQQLQQFTEESDRLSTPEGLGALMSSISDSGLAEGLQEDRLRGVEQFTAARGLRRSGAGLREAAKVPTDVLLGFMDRIVGNRLGGLRQGAQIGLGQGGNIRGGIAGLTTPANQLGNVMAQEASTKAGITSSVIGGLGQLVGLLSDFRAKENINKIGEFDSGIGIYTYNYVGDTRLAIGVMAQEVEEKIPDAIIERHGLKHVNYEKVH